MYGNSNTFGCNGYGNGFGSYSMCNTCPTTRNTCMDDCGGMHHPSTGYEVPKIEHHFRMTPEPKKLPTKCSKDDIRRASRKSSKHRRARDGLSATSFNTAKCDPKCDEEDLAKAKAKNNQKQLKNKQNFQFQDVECKKMEVIEEENENCKCGCCDEPSNSKSIEDSCADFLTIMNDTVLETVQKSIDVTLRDFFCHTIDKLENLCSQMVRNECLLSKMYMDVMDKISHQNEKSKQQFKILCQCLSEVKLNSEDSANPNEMRCSGLQYSSQRTSGYTGGSGCASMSKAQNNTEGNDSKAYSCNGYSFSTCDSQGHNTNSTSGSCRCSAGMCSSTSRDECSTHLGKMNRTNRKIPEVLSNSLGPHHTNSLNKKSASAKTRKCLSDFNLLQHSCASV